MLILKQPQGGAVAPWHSALLARARLSLIPSTAKRPEQRRGPCRLPPRPHCHPLGCEGMGSWLVQT